MQVLDRGGARRHDLVHARADAHRTEPLDVLLSLDHRVVRREPHQDRSLVEPGDELHGAGDGLVSAVDDAVEVEDHEADALGEAMHRPDHRGRKTLEDRARVEV
jgi:hypothetical protein